MYAQTHCSKPAFVSSMCCLMSTCTFNENESKQTPCPFGRYFSHYLGWRPTDTRFCAGSNRLYSQATKSGGLQPLLTRKSPFLFRNNSNPFTTMSCPIVMHLSPPVDMTTTSEFGIIDSSSAKTIRDFRMTRTDN